VTREKVNAVVLPQTTKYAVENPAFPDMNAVIKKNKCKAAVSQAECSTML
jgi:hypothetical protein